MSELRVHNLSISLDGYAAGPDQRPEQPLGDGGESLHECIFPPEGQRSEVDDAFVQRRVDGIGAGLGIALDGWGCVEFVPSASVAHVRLRRL